MNEEKQTVSKYINLLWATAKPNGILIQLDWINSVKWCHFVLVFIEWLSAIISTILENLPFLKKIASNLKLKKYKNETKTHLKQDASVILSHSFVA